MAARYYDDAIIYKIKKWMPENSNLRVLKPNETKRFFELMADDNNDQKFKLPFIGLSRNTDIELLETTKQPRSYDGIKLYMDKDATAQLNVIPIKLDYQLDIYTKTYDEGDEYLRNFLFKLINNPQIVINIPYNAENLAKVDKDAHIEHVANIKVASSVSDNSDISERHFSGQFTRWTIQFEVQDAFLFNIPYRKNWKIVDMELEISESLQEAGEVENIL